MSFGCVPSNRKLPKALKEVSGVARLANGTTYWINDGGNIAEVFLDAIPRKGAKSFSVSFKNVDWEAMTVYQDSLLCICDIGDNRRRREKISIAIVNVAGTVLQERNLRYADRPSNAEACAIKNEKLYILTKNRMQKGGSNKNSSANLYTIDLQQPDSILTLRDSLILPQRSVTDMAWLASDKLAIVAYDFRRKGPFIKTLTSVFTVEIEKDDHFRENTLRESKVRAPFTWTQYECILPIGNNEVIIASENTRLFPARWRVVTLPN